MVPGDAKVNPYDRLKFMHKREKIVIYGKTKF